MRINRVWAMPNKWTFTIPPIADLLARYVGDGKGWIDPFAGMTSPAEITNDINPNTNAQYHLDVLEFLKGLQGQYNGILFDPPYSLNQARVTYGGIGRGFTIADCWNVGRWTNEKIYIRELIKPGGMALSFGWNSCGMGKLNGFQLEEILLVCHGGAHNDTIVTVERKIQAGFINA